LELDITLDGTRREVRRSEVACSGRIAQVLACNWHAGQAKTPWFTAPCSGVTPTPALRLLPLAQRRCAYSLKPCTHPSAGANFLFHRSENVLPALD